MGRIWKYILFFYVIIMFPVCVQAAGTEYADGHFYYHLHEGYVSISGYLGSETDIEIPSSIAGIPVAEIEDDAFSGSNTIETITIPDTVTYVAPNAFSGLPFLEKIICHTEGVTFNVSGSVQIIYDDDGEGTEDGSDGSQQGDGASESTESDQTENGEPGSGSETEEDSSGSGEGSLGSGGSVGAGGTEDVWESKENWENVTSAANEELEGVRIPDSNIILSVDENGNLISVGGDGETVILDDAGDYAIVEDENGNDVIINENGEQITIDENGNVVFPKLQRILNTFELVVVILFLVIVVFSFILFIRRKHLSAFWRSKGLVLLILVLLILLVSLLIAENIHERVQESYNNKLSEELRPYLLKQTELEQQIQELEEYNQQELTGNAYLEFVVSDAGSQIYSGLYSDMQQYGFTGMLALSEEQFPGREDCMTLEQMQEMADAGWSLCLSWQGTESMDWLKDLRSEAAEAGLELLPVMFFPEGTYESEYLPILKEYGIEIVIYHREGEVLATSDEEEIWCLGSYSWNLDGAKSLLSENMSQGGNLIFTIGEGETYGAYDPDSFSNMLEVISDCCRQDNLVVSDCITARELLGEKWKQDTGELEQSILLQRQELQEQLQEVEEQIAQIYRNYLK